MAYDIDKVAKIIADLQNQGLAEAEIRTRLTQAGLPDDIMSKALQKLAGAKGPVEPAKPSAEAVVPEPSQIISKRATVPAVSEPEPGLIAKAPSIREHMEEQEEETSMDAMKAMVSAPSKAPVAKPSETAFMTPVPTSRPSVSTGGGSTDDRLIRIESAVKDIKSHVAALQQITEQVLDTNRNILLGLKKK